MNFQPLKIWLQAFRFIKNPKDQTDEDQSIGYKIKQLFSILILNIIIGIGLAFLIYLAEEFGFVSTDTHFIDEWQKTKSNWVILFLGVLAAPVIEEVLFRLFLRKKYNPIRLISFIAGLLLPSQKIRVKERIDRNWHKYYGVFFYLTVILFGLFHINYELSPTKLLFTPLLIASPLIGGLFLGYLRVRFGLLWSILLHGLFNFIAIGISLLFILTPVTDFRIENKAYVLEVNRSGFDSGSFVNTSSDTIIFENVKFKYLMTRLLDSEETNIIIEPDNVKLENISLKFISLKDSIHFKDIILKDLQEQYNFKVIKDTVNQKGWMLYLSDRKLLYQNESRTRDYKTKIIKSDSITMTMVNLDEMTETLNSYYNEIIFTTIENDDLFDFKLQNTDFDVLKQKLKEKFGLELRKSVQDKELIILRFNE